ncbi:MAG: hypothetical protein GF418_13215, partial [Chitinivibrionales bacterium]|nr:hypothetical protein [Chitinivibrionales bacterium]MBD3396578.1 hypothetical protein [Chitinivibrionales bacterium]
MAQGEKNLGKQQIAQVLHDLDRQLTKAVRLFIGGGACGILEYGFQRATGDIDVMGSVPKIGEFKTAIDNVAQHFQLSADWLNDSSKGYVGFLAPDPLKRALPFEDGFEHLQVLLLCRADIVTLKLARGEAVDVQDIAQLVLSNKEQEIIQRNVRFMSKHRPDRAQAVEYRMRELGWADTPRIRPEEIENLSALVQYLEQSGVSVSDSAVAK